MRTNYSSRTHNLVPRGARALLFPVGLLLALSFDSGCAKVCDDDGFAWQQDPSCLAAATETDASTTNDSDTEEPTETQTPTTGAGTKEYCVDADGDGYGDGTMCTEVPSGDPVPPGTVDNDDDCDDADEWTFPGAAPLDDPDACMRDVDGDDYGDIDPPNGGEGGPQPGTDCDDNDANTFPGAAENDSMTECQKDGDGDGWGDSDPPGGPDGPIKPGTDCDDNDGGNHDMCGPVCVDEDMDGYCADCGTMCPGPNPNEDCDDGDDHTFPGAAPLDDPDACMTDADEDDYGDDTPSSPDAVPGTDCDDADGTAFPNSAPLDDPPDACRKDGDDDDHGDADPENPDVTPGNDCNDAHDGINPTDSQLITAVSTGDILEINVGSGETTIIGDIDTMSFPSWLPTSIAINPTNREAVASLGFKSSLVTMNYCGAGVPTPKAMPHKKELCAIGFDADGVLWGVDGQVDELIKFKDDGSVDTAVDLTIGGFGVDIAKCGMTWDCHQSRMLLSNSNSGPNTAAIYAVNTDDATLTTLVEVADASFGSGLAYEPVSKQVLSCFDQSFWSLAIDGTEPPATQLTDIQSAEDIDDLEFAPACE